MRGLSNEGPKEKGFTSKEADIILDKLYRKLEEFERENNVTLDKGSASWCEGFVKPNFKIIKGSKDDARRTKWNANIKGYYGYKYGLVPEDYGRVVRSGGREIKILGIRNNAPKYPVEVLLDGEHRVMTEDVLKLLHNKS